jgi:hypothetical protein
VVEERDLLSLLLSAGVLVFAYRNRQALEYLASFSLLFASVSVLLVGFAATVLEGLFWSATFNFIEHAAYGLSSALLALWSWVTWMRPRREGL